jgi:hypothetical protein
MRNLYESVLDDFDIFSDNADKMAVRGILNELKEEMCNTDQWKKWRIGNSAMGVKLQGDELFIDTVRGRRIYIGDEIFNILKKYKEMLNFNKLRTSQYIVLHISGDIDDLFSDITCPQLRVSSMKELKNIKLHFIPPIQNAVVFSWDNAPHGIKLQDITMDATLSACKMEFSRIPTFTNVQADENLFRINIYAPKEFTDPNTLTTIDSILDTKYKMHIMTMGVVPVDKKCTTRNIRAVANGIDKCKYKDNWRFDDTHSRKYFSYIALQDKATINDIVDISKFKGLDIIDIRDDVITFTFLKKSQRAPEEIGSLAAKLSDGWILTVR